MLVNVEITGGLTTPLQNTVFFLDLHPFNLSVAAINADTERFSGDSKLSVNGETIGSLHIERTCQKAFKNVSICGFVCVSHCRGLNISEDVSSPWMESNDGTRTESKTRGNKDRRGSRL